MKKSGLFLKVQSEVCRALMRGEFTSLPTCEEFLQKFAPKLLGVYQRNVPSGGIRIGKNGRCVDWSKASIAKAQNTKRQKEADEIYTSSLALIRSELERNQTTLPLQ